MIQTVLIFALGFLVAAALALSVAPALWRRAGHHMRKRIEASLPMSREELQAEIDAVRAEHAMAMRRLEMKAEAIKKKAAQDLVEINFQREEIKRLQEECAERDGIIAELEAERETLSGHFSEREDALDKVAATLAEYERNLGERSVEVEELSRLYEEASLTASSRQIELVARESDIERLQDTISILRSQGKDADRAMREAVAEKSRLEEALRTEQERSAKLEAKLERMTADLSTRDERLERREREIVRLKQKIKEKAAKGGVKSAAKGAANGARTGDAKEAAEPAKAELASNVPTLLAQADGPNQPAGTKPEAERLRTRLAALLRENKKLRAEIAAGAAPDSEGEEELREHISNLAAEVVNIAAVLEGPGSPIDKALSETSPSTRDAGAEARPLSLADRVRTLREGSRAK